MQSRGLSAPHILPALLSIALAICNPAASEMEADRGLICRLEVKTLEGRDIEILALQHAGDGAFDLTHTHTYTEGREAPAPRRVATALRIANRSGRDPRLVELSSFSHGRPGAYFERVETSILTETTLGAVGHAHRRSTLVFRLTRALQDGDLNHRVVEEETFEMPLSSCQVR